MIFYYAVLFILFIALIKILLNKLSGREAIRICKEFKEVFPDRCLICSYHRYGMENGLTKKDKPDTHICIEALKEQNG